MTESLEKIINEQKKLIDKLRNDRLAFDEKIRLIELAEQVSKHALHASEQANLYSEAILETVRGSLLVLDKDMIILKANDNFYTTFNVIPGETIGKRIYDLGNQQWNIPQLVDFFEQILPEKSSIKNYEVDHNFESIGHKVMLLNAMEIYQEDNDTKRILLAIEDITEVKRIETLLTDSEERYRRLFETAKDGIVLLEKNNGTITHANSAFETMSGYVHTEILGNNLQDIGVLLDMGDFQVAMKELNSQGIINYSNIKMIPKFGQPIDTEIYMVDRAKLVQCNIRDISNRLVIENKLAKRKDELEESEEKYKILFESSPDGIAIADIETKKFGFVNPALIRMLGYTREELLNLSVMDIHPKEALNVIISKFEAQVRGEKSLAQDMPLLRKDGKTIYADINSNPVTILERKYNVGFFRDITERKKIEEYQNKIANLESLGLLAGGIAHDVNNIITVILGNISLAHHAEDSNELSELLTESENGCYRAAGITKQLLTFAKGGSPSKSVINIADLVKETSSFSLRGSNIKSDYKVQEDIWSMEGDKEQLSQVITNLTINATQAMPNGGVLTFVIENYNLEPKNPFLLTEGKYIKLTIKDQGDGISQENIEKIFLPYFTTKQTGSGLGLATTYSIIKKHGGYIDVASKRKGNDRGTTFTIYLPGSEKLFEKEKAMDFIDSVQNYKILVMDDDKSLGILTKRILKKEGHDVEVAKDGSIALEMYKRAKESGNPFNLVVSDLTVPGGMGGKELCEKLHIYDPNAVVFVSSGYSDDEVMQNPENFGFKGAVDKPFDTKSLIKMLNNVK